MEICWSILPTKVDKLGIFLKFTVWTLTFALTHVSKQLNDFLLLCLLAVRAPSDVVVLSTTGNLTVCWTSPLNDPPDGYYITSHPLVRATPTSLWINQSTPDAYWVNESVCVNLGNFTPGHTYEVGVVSLRGKDRSKRTSIIYTTGKINKDTFFNGELQILTLKEVLLVACNFYWPVKDPFLSLFCAQMCSNVYLKLIWGFSSFR